MFWTVVMEATPAAGHVLTNDHLDEAYDNLQAQPDVLGAVGFANTSMTTFGMRFDLEAENVADAVRAGLQSFLRAVNTTSLGYMPVQILRAEAVLDVEPLPADEVHELSIA